MLADPTGSVVRLMKPEQNERPNQRVQVIARLNRLSLTPLIQVLHTFLLTDLAHGPGCQHDNDDQ